MELKPFIQWAGGKKQLLKHIIPLVPEEYKVYHEPFIGGGALFFALQPKKAVINDNNKELINCYIQIRDNPDKLCNEINVLDKFYPDTEENYKTLRFMFNDRLNTGEYDMTCAALMLVLNRRCFNGLYRVNSDGEFNTSWGQVFHGKMDRVNLANVMNISKYLNENDIKICCKDFSEVCWEIQKDDFVFFDSPYIPMSETANFVRYTAQGFNDTLHQRLSVIYRYVASVGAKAILTNNDNEKARNLYAGYKIIPVQALRSINSDAKKRKTGKEIIVMNYTQR